MPPISPDDLDLSGRLGLDFVNTVVPARSGPVDLLRHPDDLAWWLAEAATAEVVDLLPRDPPGRKRFTAEAAALRDALVLLFDATARGTALSGPARACIDRALGRAVHAHRMTEEGELATVFRSSGSLGALSPIALSALRVAHGAPPHRLRPCDAPGCSRWFVDTSRGGRRRWCSMERCGNRAKAARHRKRHAGTG